MNITKEAKTNEFLDRFSESFEKTDVSGKKKEAAVQYLKKRGLSPDNLDDIFTAMDESLKDSGRLLSVEEDLARQGDSPVDVPWLCKEQADVTMQQQGIILLLLQLRNKE